MSEEGGHETFLLFENQSLGLSNSGGTGSDEKPTLEYDDETKSKKKIISKRVRGGSDHENEMHIVTERERRKKMRNMFSNLHALLPQLSPKVIIKLNQHFSTYINYNII